MPPSESAVPSVEEDPFWMLPELAEEHSRGRAPRGLVDTEVADQLGPLREDPMRYVRVYVPARDDGSDVALSPGTQAYLSQDQARGSLASGEGLVVTEAHAMSLVLERDEDGPGRLTYQGGLLSGLRVLAPDEAVPERPAWTIGTHSERWRAYLMDDQVTLRNLVGARDPETLRRREDELVEARGLELRERGLSSFDLAGLRDVHRHLFGDVYEWAGELRTVTMSKGDVAFLSDATLARAAQPLGTHLRDSDLLRAVAPAAYPVALSQVYGIANMIHPFREGNGRTQREFVTLLAAEGGYEVDWTAVTGARNNRVSREAMVLGELGPYASMFTDIVHRTDAARKLETQADAGLPRTPMSAAERAAAVARQAFGAPAGEATRAAGERASGGPRSAPVVDKSAEVERA